MSSRGTRSSVASVVASGASEGLVGLAAFGACSEPTGGGSGGRGAA